MISTFWPGFDPPDVGHGLQRGEPGDRDDCGLLEGEVRRLAGELVLAGDGVLGERARGDPEHLVADGEPGHRGADGHDGAGDVAAGHRVLRPAEAEHEAQQVGLAGHQVPGAAVETGRVHPHEHLLVADLGPGDPVARRSTSAEPYAVLDDRPHRVRRSGRPASRCHRGAWRAVQCS